MNPSTTPDATPSPPDAWTTRSILYATVAVTGAAVMVLELLGTRLIGAFYGVSLYVWASLISVALMALALGYYLGGRVADHTARFRLCHVIALAALFAAAIPPSTPLVLSITDVLGVRWGALTSALMLFMAPLTMLGMVAPMAIKLIARRLDAVGVAAGSVFGISTVGSVLGTIGYGFFLLPVMGSRTAIYGVSLALFGVASSLAWLESNARRSRWPKGDAAILIILATALAVLIIYHSPSSLPSIYDVKYETESLYGWVRVVDDAENRVRWLLSDASTISAMDLDIGESVLTYL